MTLRDIPPFRADHVGSLLRPPVLLKAREQKAAGEISADELRAIEDDAIRDVIRMQRDVGLRSATDGEFRRTSWHMDFIYRLGGIRPTDEKIQVHFRNEQGELDFESAALAIDAPVRLIETIFGDDFAFLANEVDDDITAKLTIPSPSMVHYRGGRAAIDPKVYPDEERFWADLSAAYAEQVRRVADLGCRYLQLDDTSLAYLNDPAQRQLLNERGDDAEHQHLRYIRQINAAIADRPAGLAVTTTCAVATSAPPGPPKAAMTSSPKPVQRAGRRRLLPGVRRRSLGRFFCPAAFRPARQTGRPRPGHHEEGSPRIQGHPQAPHRRGCQIRPARPNLSLAAVRFLLNGRGQRADLRRGGRQTPADRRNRGGDLGLTAHVPFR